MKALLGRREPAAPEGRRPQPPGMFVWRSSSATSRGNVRSHNEDAILELPGAGLWVVADGMGGHSAGDVASRTIVEALCSVSRPQRLSGLLDDVEDRLRAVNERLHNSSLESGGRMTGSTVAALLASGSHCLSVWAGDSRIYRLRAGCFECVTRDHSEAQALLEAGLLDAASAVHHNAANVITRAVGAHAELYLDVELRRLQDQDRYLLCSDGVYKELNEIEMARLLSRDDPEKACQALIGAALSGTCSDNVSVAVVEFSAA